MLRRIGKIVLIQLSDIDSNIYILGDTVIDSGTGFNFTRLHSILKVLKKNFESFSQVINTHGHFDHIGGNGYFLKADVAIHEADAPIIENGDVERSWADFFNGKLNPRKVDRKLKEGDVIDADGMKLEVIHTPGHSPGSVCLYNGKEKIMFSGDTIFSDGIGRTDGIGGDMEALSASIEKLSQLKIDKILPGHGEPVLSKGSKLILEMMKG